MEEKMKIHDVSTNVEKNPLLTILLHVSLSRNALSLSKNRKNIKKNEEEYLKKWEKSYLFCWIYPVHLSEREVA